MITTTCWILWIPTSGGVDVGVEDWVGPPHATATTRTPIASATRLMRPRYPSRQRRTIAETSALCKPLRARVDVEAIAAKEADEGLVEFSRQRDGQAGGRTDGGQQWNAAPTDFWTISYPARPLTTSCIAEAGRRPSRSSRPTTLSTALWRPMSSRSATTSPSAS